MKSCLAVQIRDLVRPAGPKITLPYFSFSLVSVLYIVSFDVPLTD